MCLDTRLTKMSVALAALFGTQTAQSASRRDELHLGQNTPAKVTTHNLLSSKFRGIARHKNGFTGSPHSASAVTSSDSEQKHGEPEADCNDDKIPFAPTSGMPETAPPALTPAVPAKYSHEPPTISAMTQKMIQKTKNGDGSRPASTPATDSDDGMPGTTLPVQGGPHQTQKNAGHRIQKSSRFNGMMQDIPKNKSLGGRAIPPRKGKTEPKRKPEPKEVPDYSVFDERGPRPDEAAHQEHLRVMQEKVTEAISKYPMNKCTDEKSGKINKKLRNWHKIYDVTGQPGNRRLRVRTMVFDGWIYRTTGKDLLSFRVFDKEFPQKELKVYIEENDAKRSKAEAMIHHVKDGITKPVVETIYLKYDGKLKKMMEEELHWHSILPKDSKKNMKALKEFLNKYRKDLLHVRKEVRK